MNTNANVTFSEGANFKDVTNLNETVIAAQNADYVVLVIGEDTYAEGVGNIQSLELSSSQKQLANALIAVRKSIILVYLGNNH